MKSLITALAMTAGLLTATAGPAAAQVKQMRFVCDLNGVAAQMNMAIQTVSASGVTWGPGRNPGITGVVPTGEVSIYTAGEVRSPTAHYSFTGEGEFANFTNRRQPERFLVRFVPQQGGLWMIVNPFQSSGQGRHYCRRAD